MPALSLAAAPGRRKWTIELAQEIERRGFQGIYCASFGDALGLCLSIAHATTRIRFGTGIANIYTRNPLDMGASAAYLHEVSDGRFVLGLGVSHAPANARLGVAPGRPLSDMREYVSKLKSVEQQAGALPPIVLATLRKKMVGLAAEVADGAIWANCVRSHLGASLEAVPAARRNDSFFVGNMLPVCIDDDMAAAEKVARRGLTGYLMLPNYRNYWKEAGYADEMEAVEKALGAGEQEKVPGMVSEKFLRDVTLYGPVKDVRDGLEAWFAAGMKTPILVPASTRGGQVKAFEEILAAFA
jgi:alkanesulfonate monooxygenase SsuD/methylene tetrahydromethanopterin reductase-like flavin-dependent oxidoreductase (luciferase family)